ncbi:MAG: Bax inhibitor-1/YccA family protein [Bacteroidota bacterium]
MSKYYEEIRSPIREKEFVVSGAVSEFLRQVFVTMAIGLVITGMAAWYVGTNPELFAQLFMSSAILGWVIMLAPLGVVIFLSARIHKMSFTNASIAFGLYSLINGISLSVIFMVYAQGTLMKVFFITAGTFAAMAMIGYTTKVDLSKMGSILYMALIGLIIASVVNYFMDSSMLDYIISVVGVLIFSGLTAYDMQKLKIIGANVDPGDEGAKKVALMGALNLYLDFINLFLFLLRIFGRD